MMAETMRKEGLSHSEAERQSQFGLPDKRAANREHIYLTDGTEGFAAEHRGAVKAIPQNCSRR